MKRTCKNKSETDICEHTAHHARLCLPAAVCCNRLADPWGNILAPCPAVTFWPLGFVGMRMARFDRLCDERSLRRIAAFGDERSKFAADELAGAWRSGRECRQTFCRHTKSPTRWSLAMPPRSHVCSSTCGS
eukprot:1718388-Pleurochrysis_carterae.AAC.4